MNHSEMPQAVDFRRVFETSQESYALVATDAPDFTILAVSDGGVRIALRSREELVGRSIFAVFPENPNDPEGRGQATLRDSFERVLRHKQPHTLGTFRYDAPDPTNPDRYLERYWSLRNSPVFDDAGEVLYILHRSEEVTDLVLGEAARPRRAQLRRHRRQLDVGGGDGGVLQGEQLPAAVAEALRRALGVGAHHDVHRGLGQEGLARGLGQLPAHGLVAHHHQVVGLEVPRRGRSQRHLQHPVQGLGLDGHVGLVAAHAVAVANGLEEVPHGGWRLLVA